mgnify:CR=1 FL=1
MHTGELIKQARVTMRITQAELAKRLGVTPQAISQYERGIKNPKPATLKKIAAALGVEWYELYSDDPHEQSRGIIYDISDRAGISILDKDGNVINHPKKTNAKWVKTPSAFSKIAQFNSENEKALFLYTNLNESGRYEAAKFFTEHLDKDSLPEAIAYLQQLVDTPQYQKKDEE